MYQNCKYRDNVKLLFGFAQRNFFFAFQLVDNVCVMIMQRKTLQMEFDDDDVLKISIFTL